MKNFSTRDLAASLRMTGLFVVLTGILFPVVMWGIGQAVFPTQANGSLLFNEKGALVGAERIGQQFTADNYFHPRPSAAGAGYDAANSSGTNLGPTSSKLFEGLPDDPATEGTDESYAGVKTLAAAYRKVNGLAGDALVPVDAVTRSASGLDPDITLANAAIQAVRVARARNIPLSRVQTLIEEHTASPFLGIFGTSRVNVLALNRNLDLL